MLANMSRDPDGNNICIQTGICDKQRIIDVSALHEEHGGLFCTSLAGFNALTECEYNPALFRKGKTGPL